jgi:hypothetical protein
MRYAVTALVMTLVLTGGAFAGSALVTSRQIKDRTIRMADLHPSVVRAIRATPKLPELSVVTRDGDSRTVAAGGAAELTARCQAGETAISATWDGAEIRDLYVFPRDAGNFVAVVAVNDSTIDVRVQLRALCLRR